VSFGDPSPSYLQPQQQRKKARVKARGRGKVRRTTPVTIAGAPRHDPPSTIPAPVPSQCGQGYVLVAAAGASTTTRPARYTGILRGSRRSLLRTPAGSSTTPAASYDSCLVTLDGRVGLVLIGQLLQHHDIYSPDGHRLGRRPRRLQPHHLGC
jgi:hypothetical protein